MSILTPEKESSNVHACEELGDFNQMKCACGEFANVWEGNKKECSGCYLKRIRGNNK